MLGLLHAIADRLEWQGKRTPLKDEYNMVWTMGGAIRGGLFISTLNEEPSARWYKGGGHS